MVKDLEPQVSWEEFQAAFSIFSPQNVDESDLAIVNHTDHPYVMLGAEPNEHGIYSLTSIAGMSEQQVKALITASRSLVLEIVCMDKRGARKTHDTIKRHAAAEDTVIFIGLAGGIVQEPIGDKNRPQGLRTIIRFLAQLAGNKLKQIYATGHDCQCGACKAFQAGVAVHETLDTDKGSEAESQEMKSRIAASAQEIVPEHLREKVVAGLAHFSPETDVFDRLIEIEDWRTPQSPQTGHALERIPTKSN